MFTDFADTTVNGSFRPNQRDGEHAVATGSTDGAILGPAGPPQFTMSDKDTLSAPSSPYTSMRAAIRNLTLPTIPNLDIPPSPPGSPAPGADEKFAHFLELKKQGVHFNAKLASSSALKNPSLLPKLMDFAGLEEQHQCATTLPKDLWDPMDFPEWAYKERLAQSQQIVSKKREEEKTKVSRESIDFVSATTSDQSSRGGTPGIGPSTKVMRGSAAERVMAGLHREQKAAPGLRSKMERRGGRTDSSRSGESSRSPKRRKRSR